LHNPKERYVERPEHLERLVHIGCILFQSKLLAFCILDFRLRFQHKYKLFAVDEKVMSGAVELHTKHKRE